MRAQRLARSSLFVLGGGKSVGSDVTTDSLELVAGGTQLVLELDRPQEVAVQGVVAVDADPAMQVLTGEGSKLSAFGGPELCS